MKQTITILTAMAGFLFLGTSCEQKTESEKAAEEISEAADAVGDAAAEKMEEAGDKIEDATDQ